jgi:hypothetical protein
MHHSVGGNLIWQEVALICHIQCVPNGQIAREWTSATDYPLIYAVQCNAWIDERTFLKWIRKVWEPCCVGKPSTYLLLDECTVHVCLGTNSGL